MFGGWVGNGTQQAAGVWIARPLKKFGGGRLFENLSRVHHDNVIRHPGDKPEIMCNQNYTRTAFGLQLLYQLQDLSLNRDIQRSSWLVRD